MLARASTASVGRLAVPGRVAAAGRWTLALALALATWRVWPIPGTRPTAGLDRSWEIALHLAAAERLEYGREILFTYGPLGFLTTPLTVVPTTAVLAILFSLAAWLALAAGVLAAARRSLPSPLAVAVAYLALCLPVQIADVPLVLVFLATVWALERGRLPRAPLLVAAGGALAGAELLVKFNNGIVVLLVAAIAAWRLRPGRLAGEALLVASCALSTLVLWLATGNPAAGLPGWLADMAHVVAGYAQTMALESRSRVWAYAWAGALLLACLALLGRHLGRRRPALWLAAALYGYAFLKEGFVRHDAHDLSFFGAVGVGVLAFAWRGRAERTVAVLAVVVASAAVLATPDVRLGDLLRPVASASEAVADARLVVEPGRLRGAIRDARAEVRAELALPPRLVALLRGRSVDVVPTETSAVWAYGLAWRPQPLIQDYGAYDGYLDRLDARAIAARGADRILQEFAWPGTDGTHPLLEAPATALARICHYREEAQAGPWTVLARTADRCGRPVHLGSASARAGQRVAVPAAPGPGELVYATVHLRRPLAGRLVELVLKPLHEPSVVLGASTYRFVAASADDPLVLRMAATAGLSPWLGGTVDYGAFTLRNVASPFTVDFYALPVRGPAPRPPAAPPAGRLERGALRVGGRRIPVVAGAVEGTVDTSLDLGRQGAVVGWAVRAGGGAPVDRVAVFVGGRLAALGTPELRRPDVAAALRAPAAADSGFRLLFGLVPGASVRVFGIARGRAAELRYGAADAWPHPRPR